MLDEYFSFGISEDGKIESLPLLLPGYTPNLNKLPLCKSLSLSPLITNDPRSPRPPRRPSRLGGRESVLRLVPPRARILLHPRSDP